VKPLKRGGGKRRAGINQYKRSQDGGTALNLSQNYWLLSTRYKG